MSIRDQLIRLAEEAELAAVGDLQTKDLQEAAARAYDEGALKHFGEFALTNKELGLL